MFNRISLTVLVIFLSAATAIAQTSPSTAQLKIGGAVSTPLTLTVTDLKAMPRTTISATNTHEKKTETYEGVLLETLLQKAGVSHGEKLRGALMTTYVIAEAEDGYQVVFSLAELDSGFLDSEVLCCRHNGRSTHRSKARSVPTCCAT